MRNFKIGSGEAAMRFNGDDTSAAITWNAVESYSLTSGGLRLRNVATADLPAAPPVGTTVYDTTAQAIKSWNGSSWDAVGVGEVDFSANAGTAATGATTTSEALDHYEEGTWVPNAWDNGLSSAEGQTYSERGGLFTRIGRCVHFSGYFTLTSLGTLTTSEPVYIGPLPYASASNGSTNFSAVTVGIGSNISLGAAYGLSGSIGPSTSHISVRVWDTTTVNTQMLLSELTGSATLSFSGTYFV